MKSLKDKDYISESIYQRGLDYAKDLFNKGELSPNTHHGTLDDTLITRAIEFGDIELSFDIIKHPDFSLRENFVPALGAMIDMIETQPDFLVSVDYLFDRAFSLPPSTKESLAGELTQKNILEDVFFLGCSLPGLMDILTKLDHLGVFQTRQGNTVFHLMVLTVFGVFDDKSGDDETLFATEILSAFWHRRDVVNKNSLAWSDYRFSNDIFSYHSCLCA